MARVRGQKRTAVETDQQCTDPGEGNREDPKGVAWVPHSQIAAGVPGTIDQPNVQR